MLKTSNTTSTKPRKDVVAIGGNKKKYGDRVKPVDKNDIDDGEVGNNKLGKNQKMSKSKKLFHTKTIIRSDFFTPEARLAFTELRQVFIKAPTPHYFNLKRHIWVKTNISGYAISGVLSQLTLDNLGR